MESDDIIISRTESPELYSLVHTMQNNKSMANRLLAYARELAKMNETENDRPDSL